MKRLKSFVVGFGALLIAVALLPAQSSDPIERIAALEREVAELQTLISRDYFTNQANVTLLFRDIASTNLAACREAVRVDRNLAGLAANSRELRENARRQEAICARLEAEYERKVEDYRQAQEDFERLVTERRN